MGENLTQTVALPHLEDIYPLVAALQLETEDPVVVEADPRHMAVVAEEVFELAPYNTETAETAGPSAEAAEEPGNTLPTDNHRAKERKGLGERTVAPGATVGRPLMGQQQEAEMELAERLL